MTAWPTRTTRREQVIFVCEGELSSFYLPEISYLPFRTPPYPSWLTLTVARADLLIET